MIKYHKMLTNCFYDVFYTNTIYWIPHGYLPLFKQHSKEQGQQAKWKEKEGDGKTSWVRLKSGSAWPLGLICAVAVQLRVPQFSSTSAVFLSMGSRALLTTINCKIALQMH